VTISVCIFGLLSVGLTQYIIDPAAIFSYKQAKDIANILAKRMNATNIVNFNDRLVLRYYMERQQGPKDIIVFGSSSSLQINTSLFPGRTFYNHSVFGASMEDDVAIYELCRRYNQIPKVLIIGLDPWRLNRNSGQERWHSLATEYFAGLRNMGLEAHYNYYDNYVWQFSMYRDLLSLANLKETMRTLPTRIRIGATVVATAQPEGATLTKLSDGSVSYEEPLRNRNVEVVRQIASGFASDPIYAVDRFEQLDPDYQQIFETLIKTAQKDGVDITFFLPPYHPIPYKALKNKRDRYRCVFETERYFRELAGKRSIKVFGSYDPELAGVGETDFWDGMHAKRKAVERILSKIPSN
jgi:hypothetical protein